MSKGPDAFRTISEVAEDLELPQHVLRFWETRFAQIKPLKRGGGRRYYRPDDVDLLRGIRHLLYGEGYTIRGVQRILKEQGPRFVIGAGRGDMAGIYQPEPGDAGDEDLEVVAIGEMDEEEIADEAIAESDGTAADAGDHAIEPTFDPREFRPRATPTNGTGPSRTGAGLGADEIRRLQSTLSDLLDLKRLLDSARG